VAAQEPSSERSGWGVLSVSGSTVHLVGSPLDNVNVVYSVGSPGITLDLSSAAIYASASVCAQRGCATSANPDAAWIPVNAGVLRDGDSVIVGLAVRLYAADAENRSGQPVPVSWVYDNG
jgi:hypothetical protein